MVDIVNIDHDSRNLVLVISDHLPWDQDEAQHLYLLQEKLNAYLRFIESDEITQKFPDESWRNIVINVVGKFPLSEKAQMFFGQAGSAIRAAGFDLRFSELRPH